MLDLGMIETELRPSEEAFRYEKMFQHPSIPHAAVDTFRKNYINTCNFEKSARLSLRRDIRKNMLRYYLHADDIKRLAAKGCPKKIKGIIKKLVRNHES